MGEIADKLAKMKESKRIAYLGNLGSLINANNIEQSSQYFKLLTDYEFIEAKVNHPKYGIELLIQDYDLINNDSLTNYQDNYQNITAEISKDLKLIKEAMQLSAHILKQDIKQLAGQLTGRLLPFEQRTKIQTLLKQISQTEITWLRPLTASLISPGNALIRTLTGHSNSVRAVAITNNGKYLISGSNDKIIKIWELATGTEKYSLTESSGMVTAVAVSSNGTQLISAAIDKTIKLWDIETGKKLLELNGHLYRVRTISIAPDNKHLISADDNTIKVWSLEIGKEIQTFKGHVSPVSTIAVTLDKQVISGSNDGIIKVWNLETAKELLTLKGHLSSIIAIGISQDGKHIISASSNSQLCIWNIETGKRKLSKFYSERNFTNSIAIAPDSIKVIFSYDDTLKVYNIETGKQLINLSGHSDSINALVITPDSKRLISASSDKTLKIWNLEIDELSTTDYNHDSAYINTLAIAPNGQQFLSASSDKLIKIFNLQTGEEIERINGHQSSVNAISITPDGKQFISASSDDTIKYWNLNDKIGLLDLIYKTFFKALKYTFNHSTSVNAVAISYDGQKIVSASSDSLNIWDLDTKKNISSLPFSHHKSSETTLSQTTVNVWNLETRTKLTLCKPNDDVYSLNYDKTGWRISMREGKVVSVHNKYPPIEFYNYLSPINDDDIFDVTKNIDFDNMTDFRPTRPRWDPPARPRWEEVATIHIGKNISDIFFTPYGKLETISYKVLKSQFFNTIKNPCEVCYLVTNEKLTLHRNSYSFAITSDKKWVIIVSNNNNLVVLNRETGREASLLIVNSKTEDIFLSLDGKLQTSQYQQGDAEEKNIDQLEKVKIIDNLDSINALAFTPCGNEIIFGSSDGSVRIWDWQTGNISLRRSSSPMTYKGHSNSVNALAIVPNTNKVISASSDKSLKVWDFVEKEYLFTLDGCGDGHESPINDLAVTPDGKNIISVSEDKTLKVWDLSHRKVITTFTGDSAMKCCAVAPDGVTIVAGDVLGKIYILCLEGLKTDYLTEESKNQLRRPCG